MEFDRVYLFIFLVLLVATISLMCIYILYTLQQKVTSVAMTSADVAFFPMRATAFAIRAFFRMVAFCFDTTLFGLRMFLLSLRFVLSGLETALLVWRVPIVVLLSILQRITSFRKAKKIKPKLKVEEEEKDETTKPTEQNDHAKEKAKEDENEESKMATRIYRGALVRIRKAKLLLRPDLFIMKKSGWLFSAQKYLQKKAGLEKTDISVTAACPQTVST